MRIYIIGLLLVSFYSPAGHSQDDVLASKIRAYAEAHEQNGDFMGEVVYVNETGAVTRVIVGMADIESKRAHEVGDIYHVASLTKQFTGAAIAKLAGHGVLDLDDPLAKYLPKFPNADVITVRGLVNQFAGVPDYNDFPDYKRKIHQDLSTEEVVSWIAENAGRFEPNQGYSYSNSHFALLARVIEIVSDGPYSEYLQSEILRPAGMDSAGNYSYAEIVPGRVEGYDPGPLGSLINAIDVNNSIKLGSGSLYASSTDLVNWHRALQSEKVLSDSMKEIYFDPLDSGYAMGISVWNDSSTGERMSAHDGKSPGGFAYMKRWLDSGRSLIVLSNVNSGQLNTFKIDLTRLVEGQVVELPSHRKLRSLAEDDARKLSGSYLFPPDSDIRIEYGNGSLLLFWRDTGIPQYLDALADSDWFYMRSRGDRIRFKRDEEGSVKGLEYDWGNGVQFCEKEVKI